MFRFLSINSLMTSIFGFNIVLLVITIFLVLLLQSEVSGLQITNKVRLDSLSLADELRQSSDDLTRLARTYAVTGDDKYEKMYLDVLDIRNGKKPRPVGYENVYWDLVLNYGDKPKPDGEKVVLLQAMKNLGFSDKEFKLLDEATNNSDDLVNLEVEAMNAVKGKFKDANNAYTVNGEPDLAKAANMLHSQAYHQAKVKIVKPLDAFFVELDNRTSNDVGEVMDKVFILERLSELFTFLTIISSIVGFFIVRFKVLRPLSRTSEQIDSMARQSDLTVALEESRDEIGLVGSSLNKLTAQVKSGIDKFIQAGDKISETSEKVAEFVSSAETKGREQNSQLTMVAAAVEEMVATLKEVASSVKEASTQTSQSESSAQKGKQSMDATNQVFDRLITSFERSAVTITELSEESTNMSNVLDVIKAIAEQTNLLALNAAIEAARAGEQGRGFAVVADEVRTLAQRSQESAGEIEQMLNQLQSKAQDATASINQSAKDMNDTKTNIDRASELLAGIAESSTQINQLNLSIATATQEQQTVSEDINLNISQLSQLSDQSVQEMQNFLSVSAELQKVAKDTKKVTDQFKT